MLTRALLLSLLLLPASVQGQYYAAKLDVLGFIIDQDQFLWRASLERSFGQKFSLEAGVENGTFESGTLSSSGLLYEVYSVQGLGILIGARYYPFAVNKPAPLGFFVGAYGRHRNLTEVYNDRYYIKTRGFEMGGGLNLGYKFKFRNTTIEGIVGMGGGGGSWSGINERFLIDEEFDYNFNDITHHVRLELSVGFIFPYMDNQ